MQPLLGDPADAVPVLLSDLNMLIFTGGQERMTAEYGRLLTEAGLNLGTIRPVALPNGYPAAQVSVVRRY